GDPDPGHPQAARNRPEALRHHLRDLPRPARRRQEHRRRADVAAPAAVPAPLQRPPAGLHLRGHQPRLRHDGVLRRRADRRGALGGGGLRPGAAAQPKLAARPRAARGAREARDTTGGSVSVQVERWKGGRGLVTGAGATGLVLLLITFAGLAIDAQRTMFSYLVAFA